MQKLSTAFPGPIDEVQVMLNVDQQEQGGVWLFTEQSKSQNHPLVCMGVKSATKILLCAPSAPARELRMMDTAQNQLICPLVGTSTCNLMSV